MDAIKKKMQSLKTETENAMARADQLDAEFRSFFIFLFVNFFHIFSYNF